MIKWILQKIVGSKNIREVRRIRPTVARINEIEEALQREPVEKLAELTTKWKEHLARYHELKAPPKPVVEKMSAEDLATTAQDLEIRLNGLRDEFPALPSKVDANPRVHRSKRKKLSTKSSRPSSKPARNTSSKFFPMPTRS